MLLGYVFVCLFCQFSTLLMTPNSLAGIIWQKYALRVIALFQHFSPTTFPVKLNISPRKFSLRANILWGGQAHGRGAPCKISLGYMSLQNKPSDLLTVRKAASWFEFLEESAQYSSSTFFNPIGAPERPAVCKPATTHSTDGAGCYRLSQPGVGLPVHWPGLWREFKENRRQIVVVRNICQS